MAAIAPCPDRHRLLHVAAAPPHDPDRVAKRERAGGHVRRILAEAVAGDDAGMNAARRQHASRGGADGQDGRLGVFRQRQLVLGPVEAQAGQRPAERGVGLVERRPRFGKRLGQRPSHADFLRSLSGKQKGNHRPGTEAAAISCSTRGMKSLVANR